LMPHQASGLKFDLIKYKQFFGVISVKVLIK
jgi:hypothetical protein